MHNFPTIDLPMPPSANHIWRTGRKRVYRSPKYIKWREDAAWLIKANGFDNLDVGSPVSIEIGVAWSARGDCDNRIKATQDLLVAAGVIPDDDKAHVQSVRAYWTKAIDSGIRVTVCPAMEGR